MAKHVQSSLRWSTFLQLDPRVEEVPRAPSSSSSSSVHHSWLGRLSPLDASSRYLASSPCYFYVTVALCFCNIVLLLSLSRWFAISQSRFVVSLARLVSSYSPVFLLSFCLAVSLHVCLVISLFCLPVALPPRCLHLLPCRSSAFSRTNPRGQRGRR